jgi:hypothetical protein
LKYTGNEPISKYEKLFGSYFPKILCTKFDDGTEKQLVSNNACKEILMVIDTNSNLDHKPEVAFLSNGFIDEETGLNLQRIKKFRDFTKLTFYIEEKYKDIDKKYEL